MLKPIRLSRLGAAVAVVDGQGRPTPLFIRYFNDVLQQLEVTINGVIAAQEAAEAAQEQALAALQQALDALSEAVSASSAAAAAQTTADSKLSKTQADDYYVKQDGTPNWSAVSGSIERSTFSTYSAPTISPSPTQAEVQALADAVQAASRHLGALIGDLITVEALTG